jgi:hypothetical protein
MLRFGSGRGWAEGVGFIESVYIRDSSPRRKSSEKLSAQFRAESRTSESRRPVYRTWA